jgi:hypothetical protein
VLLHKVRFILQISSAEWLLKARTRYTRIFYISGLLDVIVTHRNSYTNSVKVPTVWAAYQQSQVSFFQLVSERVVHRIETLYWFHCIFYSLLIYYALLSLKFQFHIILHSDTKQQQTEKVSIVTFANMLRNFENDLVKTPSLETPLQVIVVTNFGQCLSSQAKTPATFRELNLHVFRREGENLP